MKLLFTATLISLTCTVYAQKKSAPKYRRSSLYTVMVNNDTRPHAKTIKDAFIGAAIPDKFNDHNLKDRCINIKDDEDKQQEDVTKYLNTNEVAKSVVSKWFNRDANGCFNMNLVAERGFYNASEMDVKVAGKSKRGMSLLADAGEELIGNTFVLISDFKYISKEEIAKKAKRGIGMASAFIPGGAGLNVATTVSKTALTVGGKGYVVKTTSYLYRLNWNDSIAAVFYNDYWMDKKLKDDVKKDAFEKSGIFTLKFIGQDVAWADVQSSIFTKKSEDELVVLATTRSVDAVIAKLQKNHEEFRTFTPLYSDDPLTAKIGMKEGVEAGDKYNVLEQSVDENGKTVYTKVGLIKVDGTQVWDNRYMATPDSVNAITSTLFTKVKGGDFYPGMLIKEK